MTVSSIAYGVAVYGSACILSVYGAPVVVWLSGSGEGAVRSVGNIAIIAKKCICCESEEELERAKEDLIRNWQLLKGCGIMGGVSLIPVIGTYYGWKYIYKETRKHEMIQSALERSRNNQSKQSQDMFELLMTDDVNSDQLKEKHIANIPSKKFVSVEQLDDQARQLDNTLIRTYIVYTATHYTAKKVIVGSCFGVRYGIKAAKYGCQKTKEIFGYLFKRKLLRRAMIYTATKVVEGGKFCAEVINQEVQCTLGYADQKSWRN